jgi:hypothetical protein
MSQYLASGYLPEDFDPSAMTPETIEAIHAINREMDAAGVTKFACGLSPVVKSVRRQSDGTILVTDGPYLETKEHIGGLSILETADLDEAVQWARKVAVVCRSSSEVRPMGFGPGGLDALNQSNPAGEGKSLYLLALYRPDDDSSPETEETTEQIMKAIHSLNLEMSAAGARKCAAGLSPAGDAKSLRSQPDGKVVTTDGPYTETKEHIGGFWILGAADLDEAVEWGRKAAVACRASGEVRQIFFVPDPKAATE